MRFPGQLHCSIRCCTNERRRSRIAAAQNRGGLSCQWDLMITLKPMNEEWRACEEFPAYQVSSLGRIRRVVIGGKGRKPALLSGSIRYYGGRPVARMVILRKDGKTYCVRVHRLVLLAFVGPCPEGKVACHFDGNPEHNHVPNLRWDTMKANQQDSLRHGTKHNPPILWQGTAVRHRGGKRYRASTSKAES